MENSRTWRDEAIEEALRAFNYENGEEALVVATRRAQPTWPIHAVDANRERAVVFVETECESHRSLLATTHRVRSLSEEDDSLYLGWWEVVWGGKILEVALYPREHNNQLLCLSPGEDAEHLAAFARAISEFAARPTGRALLFSGNWENAPELDAEIGRVTWDDIVLPTAIERGLREAVSGFFGHREIMREFGFAWKRGILLVGPPGTGKTMVCKAVAAELPELPFLYVRDLTGYGNPINRIFARARELAPCILAFEDIDGMVGEGNRTLFLNEMDGFTSNEGLLIIASSNHPGKIDEALLKRPSRFDRVFHLGLPAEAERRAFCERTLRRSTLADKLNDELNVEELAEQVAAKTDGFTPAYLKEAFVAAALQRAQDGATSLDRAFADAVLAQVDELKAHLKRLKDPDALAEMRPLGEGIGFRR